MPNPFLGRTTQSSNGGLLYRPVHARTLGPGPTAVGPWRSVGGQGLQAIGQALMAAGAGGWQNFGPGFLAGLQNAQEDEARREERAREDQLFGMQVDQYEAEKQDKADAKAEAARKKAARDAAIDTLPVDDATKAMLKAVDATPGYGDLVQKPKGPQSDLGRLKADLDAGLIDPKTYAAEIAKQTALPQGPVTWSDIKDSKGNVIGQRSTTGEVKYFSNGPGSQGGPFSGNGLDAQSYNIVLQGDPSSPEYAAAYAQLATPKVTFDPVTQKSVIVSPDMSWARPPQGAAAPQAHSGRPMPRTAQSSAPSTFETFRVPGGSTVTATAGQGVKQSPEEAAKITAMQEGAQDIADAIGILAPGGTVDQTNVVTGQQALGVQGVPFTAGRDARQKLQRGIEGILRAMTGAAAPDSEVARYMSMFFPSPADDDATKLNKLQRAQSWVNGILEQLRVGRPQLQGGSNSGGTDYESMYGLKPTN